MAEKTESVQPIAGPRKLRILCFHGYNNTSEIMMFQMQDFINTMSDICEFVFLDGPKNVTREPPLKYFVDKGIRPPFKRWGIVNKPAYRSLPDGSTRMILTKTQVNLDDILETGLYVCEFMNRQDVGFDGFAGFS